ncbi:hypothetical protein [Zhongshania sp. BJYM1]|nr:hypothetical protein [Marortus sp. BJYM1]
MDTNLLAAVRDIFAYGDMPRARLGCLIWRDVDFLAGNEPAID